jgi:hypothetical protein
MNESTERDAPEAIHTTEMLGSQPTQTCRRCTILEETIPPCLPHFTRDATTINLLRVQFAYTLAKHGLIMEGCSQLQKREALL